VALALTTFYMGCEVVAGLWSGSLALLSDAGHMLTDARALALALYAQRLGRRARTHTRTFGYRRAGVLAAAANGVLLGITAIMVVVEAVRRLHAPPEVAAKPMVVVAGIGLVVNLFSAWLLSGGGAGDVNVRAAAAHVLSDAAGSVAAILAGVLILAYGWTLADPIISIAISALICFGSWRLLREAVNVLMEGPPPGIDVPSLEKLVCATAGVAAAHDLHVWSIVGDTPVVTVHVSILPGEHGTDVARRVGKRLEEALPGAHVTVQPEPAPPPLVSLRGRRAP